MQQENPEELVNNNMCVLGPWDFILYCSLSPKELFQNNVSTLGLGGLQVVVIPFWQPPAF